MHAANFIAFSDEKHLPERAPNETTEYLPSEEGGSYTPTEMGKTTEYLPSEEGGSYTPTEMEDYQLDGDCTPTSPTAPPFSPITPCQGVCNELCMVIRLM